MPKPRRTWLDFPSQFLTVFQNLAAATPPIVCGPKTKGEAEVFRKGFYAFRDALQIHFAVAQRLLPISQPMFSDEEMDERIEELKKG
jgi:hypothetical protein